MLSRKGFGSQDFNLIERKIEPLYSEEFNKHQFEKELHGKLKLFVKKET